MRPVAFRRVFLVMAATLAVIALLAGCSTAVKRNYLRHLEVTIAPTATPSPPALAAVDTGQ